MTDSELLELAAKAAGIELRFLSGVTPFSDGPDRVGEWNPLTNDGDALRLAVKLRIDLVHTNIHSPQVHGMADLKVQVCEESGIDPYAATRRAIVRAAAAMAKEKQ